MSEATPPKPVDGNDEPPPAAIDWAAAAEWGRRQNVHPEAYPGRRQHLAAINQARRDLGLPRYRIVRPVGRPDPLPAASLCE